MTVHKARFTTIVSFLARECTYACGQRIIVFHSVSWKLSRTSVSYRRKSRSFINATIKGGTLHARRDKNRAGSLVTCCKNAAGEKDDLKELINVGTVTPFGAPVCFRAWSSRRAARASARNACAHGRIVLVHPRALTSGSTA